MNRVNRITQRLKTLKSEGRKALVSYIVNGDPAPEVTLPALHELVKQGADIIELGVPFSDPMADGPVIQFAHERALANAVTLKGTLEVVKAFRETDSQTPVVLMGYANPVERMGYRAFAEAAAAAGVDGLLTVDLPPEEAGELNAQLKAVGIETIFLLAPTTKPERIKLITSLAGGFLYYVSLKGVTGAGHLDVAAVEEKLTEIRQHTELPVCVGFGIKDADSARAVAQAADGVVVGSAFVKVMGDMAGSSADQVAEAIGQIAAPIRAAINEVTA